MRVGWVVGAAGALFVGLTRPVVYMRRGLDGDSYSVLAGILDLGKGGNYLLALILFAFSVVFPIAKLAALLVLLAVPLSEERQTRTLRALGLLGRWSMLDVFVIAILVGSVELGVLSEAEPRPGLYWFAAAIVLSMVATMRVTHALAPGGADSGSAVPPARGGGLRWISVISGVLFVVGLWLPLMSVEKWHFWGNQYSVLEGIWNLASEGEGVLAFLMLLFVVLLPLARFVGLAWLGWGPSSEGVARAVLLIDKWAMLDVFGLALLIVIVKIADIASVAPEPGFWVLLLATFLSLADTWRVQRGVRR